MVIFPQFLRLDTARVDPFVEVRAGLVTNLARTDAWHKDYACSGQYMDGMSLIEGKHTGDCWEYRGSYGLL
jgi:hypothetical protein